MGLENIFIPIMVVVLPMLIVYSQLRTQTGLVGGAIIGIVIGVSSNVLPTWMITVAILALASIIFVNVRGNNESE